MVHRRRHPNKHIEGAIQYAENHGWRIVEGGSRAWGTAYCPHAQRDGCRARIDGMPRVPEYTARRLLREAVDTCSHQGRN